jgi:uncharacterized protein YaiL (DUF2058 family)
MQNLRDQLLKAGVATKQQKQQVEQEKRRKRKKQQKGQAEAEDQAQQRRAHEDRLAAQRVADRERAAAQRAVLDAKETQLRLQNIIDYWQLPEEPDGRRRWYFTTRRHTINYLYVSNPTADRLSAGDVAIVEQPGAEEEHYVMVEREAAEHIAPIDRRLIRFSNSVSTDT